MRRFRPARLSRSHSATLLLSGFFLPARGRWRRRFWRLPASGHVPEPEDHVARQPLVGRRVGVAAVVATVLPDRPDYGPIVGAAVAQRLAVDRVERHRGEIA